MAVVTGALVVDLDAETATFNRKMIQAAERVRSSGARMNRALARIEKGFRRASRSVAAFAKRNLSLRNAVVTLAGGAGLGLLIKRAIDAGDAIAKTADAVGISTDALQELRFAADLSGVSIEQFDKALFFAVKTLGELRTRTSSELTTALKDFDAQLLDNIRTATSMEAAIDLVFRRMGELEDQTLRAALAKSFFGRGGVALTNIVRGEAGALEKNRAEARRLGLVLEGTLLRGAERAKDQLAILGKTISTTVNAAVLKHADAIAELATRFSEAIPKLISWVRSFGEWVGLLERVRTDRLAEIQADIERLSRVRGVGRRSAERERAQALIELEKEVRAEFAETMRAAERAARAVTAAKAAAIPTVVDPFAGRGVPKRKPITIDIIASRDIAIIDKVVAKIRTEVEATAAAHRKLKDAADAVFIDTRTPMEEYQARIVELNRLREQSAITENTYTRAVKRAQDAMVAQNEIAQAGTRIFDNFGEGILHAMQRGEDAMASFRNAAVAALFDVQRELFKTLAFDPFKKFLFSTLTGLLAPAAVGGGGSQPIPIAAVHGARSTPAGQPFLVGERGRELVVPPRGSTIVPSGGFGGITINQSFDFRGADAGVFAKAQLFKEEIKRETIATVTSLLNSGGSFAKAAGRR